MGDGPNTAALVVAAGQGLRAGGAVPKQYQLLGGEPLLRRTLCALLAHPGVSRVLVVYDPSHAGAFSAAVAGLDRDRLLPPVAGGHSRQASVRAGLEALAADTSQPPPDLVLIHDAARPFVSSAIIDRTIAALARQHAAFPALPVVDALWRADEGMADHEVPRAALWRAQTPQGFRFAPILDAHRQATGDAPDDVAVARAAGLGVEIVPGEERNFKITLPADFVRAERLMETHMDIRTGQGFDVHAFGPGDHVTLCGVDVPHDKSLSGHSDADVGLHALTDAVFGALAEGDIGQWFPPSDPQWKGARSDIFLQKAVERATARGFRITHLDLTLICEAPRIGPHAAAMRDEVARITGLEVERISVKATTSEKLGFTGRGEGIAAMATATLVSA